MSKSTSLVVGSRVDPLVAAQLHQCVISAGAISAASAVLCGLELQAVQKALKSARTCTFDEWLEKHEDQLGFTRRTAFKYKAAALETKAKLLKTGDKALRELLEQAPGSMKPEVRQKLLKAVSKCIGATTLMDIYLEAGIVKNAYKAPTPRLGDGSNPHGGAPREIDEQKMVEEEFYLPLSQLFAFAEKSVKRGKDYISPIVLIPKERWISHRAEWLQIIEKGDSIHGLKK